MTREFEELVDLYAEAIEKTLSAQDAAKNRFRRKCRDVAARTGLKINDIETHVISAYHKIQSSSDRRSGRPTAPRGN